MPDKVSQEKIALLRAYGAEVVVCPTVDPESPESYYSVSTASPRRSPAPSSPTSTRTRRTPRRTTGRPGPEIWEQTGGEVDVLVFSVGTGGTISGTARYLKEQKPDLKVVGADPEGSIYSSPTRAPVPRRGDRRGLLADDLRPVARRRVRDRVRPDSFRRPAGSRARRASSSGGSGGTAVWAMLRSPSATGRDRRSSTLIPDSGAATSRSSTTTTGCRVRHPRAARARAHDRGGARIQAARRTRASRSRHRDAPQGRPGDRADAAYGISQIPVVEPRPMSRGRRRLGARARPPGALSQPGRAERRRAEAMEPLPDRDRSSTRGLRPAPQRQCPSTSSLRGRPAVGRPPAGHSPQSDSPTTVGTTPPLPPPLYSPGA